MNDLIPLHMKRLMPLAIEKRFKLFLVCFCLCQIPENATAQRDSLSIKIEKIVESLDAKVGVAIRHIERNDTISFGGNSRLPMMSIYKFPIALTVLTWVEKGELKMDQQVKISTELIHPEDIELFSAKNFPEGKASISELLSRMLIYGSNTACDILLSEINGPGTVQEHMHTIGIKDIAIENNERELQNEPTLKYRNWSTANELVKLLIITYQYPKLSRKSYDFLWEKMMATVTGPDRLKALLPIDVPVAHRTGTARGCYNDVGIVTLPNGSHFAIAVLISNANETPETCNRAIADIAKLAWDYYAR